METSFEKKTSGHPQGIPNYVGHLHAENMKLYAEDATVNEKPWELWEFFENNSWCPCSEHPEWNVFRQYRRKPKTININGFEVPSPIRDPLNEDEICYIVDLTGNRVCEVDWCNTSSFCKQWLKSGIIHKTEEAAELHLKALLSFTQQP